MTQNYTEGYEYLSSQFPEVSGYDFYREMFPNNERSDEQHMDYSHPNAIYLYREQTSDGFKRMRRRVMFSDQWETDYMEFIERNPLTLCSGLAYRGKSNKLEHAQRMNALIFDLDGVGLKELRNLFFTFWRRSDAASSLADADVSCFVRNRPARLLFFPGANRSIPEY